MAEIPFAFQFLETTNVQAFSFHRDQILAELREVFNTPHNSFYTPHDMGMKVKVNSCKSELPI